MKEFLLRQAGAASIIAIRRFAKFKTLLTKSSKSESSKSGNTLAKNGHCTKFFFQCLCWFSSMYRSRSQERIGIAALNGSLVQNSQPTGIGDHECSATRRPRVDVVLSRRAYVIARGFRSSPMQRKNSNASQARFW